MSETSITVIGGGLAGSEAAWQAAEAGVPVVLYEMRPHRTTPAHTGDLLGELVCSNSLGSKLPDRPTGLLQEELRRLSSMVMAAADSAALPAGGALAVDRDQFAGAITDRLGSHPLVDVRREEVTSVPEEGIVVVASGPLTSPALAEDIRRLTGTDDLYFYDAIAPVVEVESLDMSICFRGSRYDRGTQEEGDYLNCPMSEDEYRAFVESLRSAQAMELRDFERDDARFFEGCLPVEELARRGDDTLAFGPLRPVGLTDPRTGRWPKAVVQLRQDNAAGTLYNLVGFQTNLKYGEQERVFRMIPGLAHAEFARLGQMHRNTFINAPALLDASMVFRTRPGLFFAGQITGSEGYVGNVGTGYVAGVNAARHVRGEPLFELPRDTMLGALCWYLSHAAPRDFQPMKANFGLMPPLPGKVRGKRNRCRAHSERALAALEAFVQGRSA